ncbi:MAG: response regulator [Myxococcota bacterium]
MNRILVVDDEPFITQMLGRMLKQHDVTTATSGVAALELLENDAEFGVVLCDLMMPEITGMDLYDRVKVDNPGLAARFVFMTGGAFYPEVREFVARKERPCLGKPFDRNLLLETIDEVLPSAE